MSDGQPKSTSDRRELLQALKTAPCHRLSEWPNPSVPKVAAGVYTFWEHGRLIYVGMSGRGLAAEDIAAPDEPAKAKGLWTRPDSHASGRRNGDQFCVYVCDRFVVPHLSLQQQAQVGDGVVSLDALTRKHIHEHFEYRYVTVDNGSDALALERDVQRGALSVGCRPLSDQIAGPAGRQVVADLRVVRARLADELPLHRADLRIGGCLRLPQNLFADG